MTTTEDQRIRAQEIEGNILSLEEGKYARLRALTMLSFPSDFYRENIKFVAEYFINGSNMDDVLLGARLYGAIGDGYLGAQLLQRRIFGLKFSEELVLRNTQWAEYRSLIAPYDKQLSEGKQYS